jgi:transcriptional regulator with AAA-type ATPase domain
LLASELFGHGRGAFTGATERRAGLIAAAEGGTLFLDEIGDLSLPGQAMLLRFLQEREVRPVGCTRAASVDVRVVAATNKDVRTAIARGEVRADLLDRLVDLVVTLPPLRERVEDIVLLARHFLSLYAGRHGMAEPPVDAAVQHALLAYDRPGNVRELEKTMNRFVLLGRLEDAFSATDVIEAFGVPRGSGEGPAATPGLSRRQQEAIRLVRERGTVRRADLVRRFGISAEAARRDLAALTTAGILGRRGRGRATTYLLP